MSSVDCVWFHNIWVSVYHAIWVLLGALRIPIQQFTSDMISFLSQRIPKTSDEYELLQTHHVGGHLDEHEHAGSVSSSQIREDSGPWSKPLRTSQTCMARE